MGCFLKGIGCLGPRFSGLLQRSHMFARGFYNNSARLGIRASTSQGLLFLKLSPEGLVIFRLGWSGLPYKPHPDKKKAVRRLGSRLWDLVLSRRACKEPKPERPRRGPMLH